MRQAQRVLIVDDDPIARRVLSIILQREGHTVAAQVSNGQDALVEVTRCMPSLMLLDMDMPRMEGLSVLRRLQLEHPWLPVVVLSMLSPALYGIRCMRLGARGYLNKDVGVDLLPEFLRQISSGRLLYPRLVEEGDRSLKQFSDRELVCLRCLARGGGPGDIASTLMITNRSVAALCERLQARLGFGSIADLRSYSQCLGLI